MTSRQGTRRGSAVALTLAAALGPATALAQEVPSTGPLMPTDAEAEAIKSAQAWPITLDIGAKLGGSVRLGSAPSLAITDRTGVLLGGGATLAPSRLFSVDLEYEHVNLGSERLGAGSVGSASVKRDAHTTWADLRVYPVRERAAALFAGLGVGLAWQSADASHVVDTRMSGGAVQRAQIVQCSASAPASVGLRASVGVEVPLGSKILFVSDVSFENARLSGELLDACISGAGTTSLLALRAGLAYRLDLSRLFP